MQTKKVRDILPPARAKEQKIEEEAAQSSIEQRPSRRRPRKMLSFLFLLVLMAGIGGALSLQFFFAKAQVVVWPSTSEITAQERIVAYAGIPSTENGYKSIVAQTLGEEKALTRLFPATGTSMEQGRARGMVRVFNGFSTYPQKLVAQTRFLSEEGKLFRSPQAVVVPAGRMEEGKLVAGSLDIEVVAVESGEEYNIGPSNFSLPGLFGNPAYTSITAKSFESMSGGAKTDVLVVTESDLNAARDSLVAELQEEVRSALEAAVPEDMVLLPESIDLQVAQAFSPIKAGALLDSFNFSVKVQGSVIVFPRLDVENIAKALLRDLVGEGKVLADTTLGVAYKNIETNRSNGSISFDITTKASAYAEIDPTELRARLAGFSKEEALVMLLENPALKKAEIVFFPFWLESLPQDPDRVDITLVID